jgi:hypothetical protein
MEMTMTDLGPATPDGQGDLGPPGATIAYCPLPDCPWAVRDGPGALADVFGWGVYSASAAFDRLQKTERTIREHLEAHDLAEWVIALTKAHDRIRELELTTPAVAASSATEGDPHA